jgi:methyl-accepting chemotaxis protein
VAIKEAMEPAVATFVESVRKTNEDFRTGSSEGLSDAIATSAQKLQESLERVGDRYNQQFIDLSRRLTESFEGLHGPVSKLSDSLQRQDAVLGQAVERLNASAGVADVLSSAAGSLSTAAQQLSELKESWELSAARNQTAATAQDRAAQTNDRVSARFTEAVGNIEKFQEGMETAAKVVGSLGAPMHDLHGVLGNLPEIVRDIEGVRKSSDIDRDNNIRQITGDLASTVSKAVEQLAGYSEVAKSLEIAAEKMGRATQSLEGFASHIDSGSASQERAATAAEDAARYNAKAASVLEAIPNQLGGMNSSLSSTAQALRESAQTTAKGFELEAEQQRRFLQELGNALGEYMDGIRGKTQERISEFGEKTIHVIQKLEALQTELNNGVETVQEVGSQLLTKGRR